MAYRPNALSTTEAIDALLCERVNRHSKATVRAFISRDNARSRIHGPDASRVSYVLTAIRLSESQSYAASAVRACNLLMSRDFWRFAVPFLITPLLAALSKRLVMVRHSSCAVSMLPSSRAISVCFITVRSVDLRCRLRIRFVLSARACFFADCRCKTNTPFESFSPDVLKTIEVLTIFTLCILNDTTKCRVCPYFFWRLLCEMDLIFHVSPNPTYGLNSKVSHPINNPKHGEKPIWFLIAKAVKYISKENILMKLYQI